MSCLRGYKKSIVITTVVKTYKCKKWVRLMICWQRTNKYTRTCERSYKELLRLK